MYTVTETLFTSEFRALSEEDKKIVAMIMRKICNNRGLKKGDFKDHVLISGKFKTCHDCHPFTNFGNDQYVLIYQIKGNKLIFKRINTHKILQLSE